MTWFHSTLRTPFGLFSVATDPDGFVGFTAFGPLAALQARAGARTPRPWSRGVLTPSTEPDDRRWRPAGRRHAAIAREVAEYGASTRHEFSVPVRATGSAFQQRVWSALSAIPAGETRSYGELARALQTAPRAVGRANATNPVCLFIPCHRVIGGDGTLTGFAFGNEVKAQLLRHEMAWARGSHSSAVNRGRSTPSIGHSSDRLPAHSAAGPFVLTRP